MTLREDLELLHYYAERSFVSSKQRTNQHVMRLPPGCIEASEQVVRLDRSAYGFKQAGRCWHSLLVRQLEGFGLERCQRDPFVFCMIGKNGKMKMVLGVSVDDMIVASSSANCDHLDEHLNQRFSTNNFGELMHYTGYSLERDRKNNFITLFQDAYIERLLERFKIS